MIIITFYCRSLRLDAADQDGPGNLMCDLTARSPASVGVQGVPSWTLWGCFGAFGEPLVPLGILLESLWGSLGRHKAAGRPAGGPAALQGCSCSAAAAARQRCSAAAAALQLQRCSCNVAGLQCSAAAAVPIVTRHELEPVVLASS